MIIVDVSAWIRALIDDSAAGDAARQVLTDDPYWSGPAHMPVEVLRTLRRYEAAGAVAGGLLLLDERLARAAEQAGIDALVPKP